MKTLTRPLGEKNRKEESFKFRLTAEQRKFWEESLRELHFEDLSSYIRHAVDRAIAQDFRSKDPKWQAFMTTIQEKAEHVLGSGLEDNLEDRLETYRRVERHKNKNKK